MSNYKTYCGFIGIVGRSNVGKSTLLNRLLSRKVSITSHKANTTRHCIFGIHTEDVYQAIYIDTPGIFMKEKHAINNFIHKSINHLLDRIKLFIFMVEGSHWTLDEQIILKKLRDRKVSVILSINKVDKIKKKVDLLPYLQFLSTQMNFLDIVPMSAKTGMNVDIITSIVRQQLPEACHFFSKERITNCSEHCIASEIIREKLIRFYGDELPYSINVKIERFERSKSTGYTIGSTIFVKRKGQKRIIIGNNGTKIKKIGIEARKDMEKMFKISVHLELWVKMQSPNWFDINCIMHNHVSV